MQELAKKLRSLPDAPGVYQYFDQNGRLLYVGKAKSLKKRVKSYFRFSPTLTPAPNLSPRIFKMIHETKNLEYIVVESENDALILENSLIKQLKPKYNILLRDDKTYPYLYVDFNEIFPRIKLTRKVVQGSNIRYFGPFPSAAKEILDSLYELFPLVQKESCIKGKKACLFYQMKRCLAPCEGYVTPKEYAQILDKAIFHLKDKQRLIEKLQNKMHEYAEQLRFEEAASLRDRIKKIESVQIQSGIDFAKMENLDIFAIEENEKQAVLVRLFMREGKVISSSSTLYRIDKEKGFDKSEAYKRALLEFYQTQTPLTASRIIVAHDFSERDSIQNYLSEKFGKKITVQHPLRGEKRKIANLALLNAQELLKKSTTQNQIEDVIKTYFQLRHSPYRIEAFDNSHISGSNPVGAMVVYENGKFVKSDYRHYSLHHKDEYAQMKELLTRRCESFASNPPPDLWLIDGGETLRQLAEDILQSHGVVIDVIAIAKEKSDAKTHRAKGKAKDILYSSKGIHKLSPADEKLLFFQKIRDEVHRFALNFHRKKRQKESMIVELLKVKGIGEGKLKKLLRFYGSFEKIKEGSFEELQHLVGEKAAQKILEHLSKHDLNLL
ncbi:MULTISPECIES: excinuclease ABC subunit UvrC [unclassified Nitratiruptor]|uniref:excinuclease ABC subunit UvrC n=1 Tax=unclassified Nitratiruptor TaxID=2624044 RepID=UPI00191674D2|nr:MULTISPECIES: excinuclease ABC subunit UvrC [unclassified Nitratiruptor]BCD60651.1 excinuclease ABC subunit C [Nitratiruptor sp. YY08-10]BCD64582.1 excinuclease ABC subunit C [Nitratiruptor sp. YY08-14]